ncbi:hypothetical protein [Streptomyces sp. Wb2n-11]|uniref:hypothetical protein n=1 Tax=Streptomyces sp. Wb2n-11 TaxID=1030533 RepID=UPI000B245B07|nr:hypothetical protein [Streptomyces sp. Wb2n-11]
MGPAHTARGRGMGAVHENRRPPLGPPMVFRPSRPRGVALDASLLLCERPDSGTSVEALLAGPGNARRPVGQPSGGSHGHLVERLQQTGQSGPPADRDDFTRLVVQQHEAAHPDQ